MTRRPIAAIEVLDETTEFSFAELCRICGVHGELVIEMIDEGVAAPRRGRRPERWHFSGVELRRVQTALRLQHDLGVNLAGAALALDLLDELEDLRRRLRRRAEHESF